MEAGLYWQADDYRLTLGGTLTATGGGGYTGSASARLRTQFDSTTSTVTSGIILGLLREHDGTTSTTTATFDIPLFGLSQSYTLGAGSHTIEFRCSLKIWRLNTMVWRTEIRNMALWVNGVQQATWADPATMPESLFGSLSYIPIFGHPPELTAGGGFTPAPPDTLALQVENFAYGGEAVATGGWSHDGVTHAVALDVKDGMSGDCCGDSAPFPTLAASTTGNASASGSAWFRSTAVLRETQTITQGGLEVQPRIEQLWDCTRSTEGTSSSLWLLPDLDQGVIKATGPDYAALIARRAMPSTVHSRGGTCATMPASSLGYTETVLSSTVAVHPSQSVIVSHVGPTTHPIEDTFAQPMIAPYSCEGNIAKRTGTKVVVTQAGIFVDPGPEPTPPSYVETSSYCAKTRTSSFPTVQTGTALAIHRTTFPVGHYLNTWGCRLASMYYWFPPNWSGDDPVPASAWLVQSQETTALNYWQPLRTQWMGNSFLPLSERTNERVSLISAGLLEDAHFDWVGSNIAGDPTSFWGISRFHVDNTAPLEEFVWRQTDTGSFSTENCTLTFNPTRIVVNPSAATCEVRLDVAGFDRVPFLYPHLCDRYWLDWDTANVDSLAVYLENFEGERLLIADAPLADWRKGLTRSDTKFAGSWVQDFNQGVAGVTDTGFDVDPNGDSVGRMSDPEGVFAFQFHGTRTRWRIVWVITPTSLASNVELHYPRVAVAEGKGAAANAVPIHENGHQTAIVWANGPGVRYGGWSWLRTIPTVQLLTIPDINIVSSPPSGASLAEALRAAQESDWVNQSVANGFTLPQNLNRTLGY